MATQIVDKQNANVVSALHARSNLGKLLERVDNQQRSLVISKHGAPKALLLSIRDYVKMAAPEPEVLRMIGEHSKRREVDPMASRQIDDEIKKSRAARRARKKR